MGIFDDFLKQATPLVRAIAESGLGRVDAWATERESERRTGDIDSRLEKAAAAAKAAGKDGTHDDHGFGDGGDFHEQDDGPADTKKEGWTGKPPEGPHNPQYDPKAIRFDPFDIVSLMGFREKPGPLTYLAVERVATQVPVVSDIIRTRCKQVQTFCQRPEDRHSAGMKVRLRDQSLKPTPESDKLCRELEDVILNCGYTDPSKPGSGVPLRRFCGMFVRDSLSFDQATIEIIPDRTGRPSHWVIVDPTTIRLVDPVIRDQIDTQTIQVIDGIVVADFNESELAFCTRNPRSGIHSYGYGESEIETLVREITGFLWGIEYNRRFFSQGSATKGILNFKGTMPDDHLKAFRRQWYAMISGVSNAWRTPVTNAEDLQWINLQMSNRDMEYSAWIDFLIKVCCARFSIAPEEVNFSYGNTGQSQAMGNTSTEEKLKASRDLGLRPLVHWFFEQINRHFLQRLHPDFEVVPVGLDEKGVEAETNLLAQQTKIYMMVDEARQAVGMEALPDDLGQVILDPTWLQYTQGLMGDEEEEGGGFGGDDGDDGDNEDVDWGVEDEDGNGFDAPDAAPDADDENPEKPDDNPGVAKSQGRGIDSRTSRVVRYELAAES